MSVYVPFIYCRRYFFFQKELSGRLLSGKLSGGNTVFYFIWDGLYFGQPAPSPY